jgi:hypothetical protein
MTENLRLIIEYKQNEIAGLIAERDKLKEEVEGLREYVAAKDGWATPGVYCFQTHMGKLVERVSELEQALENIVKDAPCYTYPWVVNIARAALEKIKFRNLPGTTNHELAKEALSRTSSAPDTTTHTVIMTADRVAEDICNDFDLDMEYVPLVAKHLYGLERVSELEVALKQIADPLLSPLLSRRDIARAALEPIKAPEPPPHDPMDAHWQALVAERDRLKEILLDVEAEFHNAALDAKGKSSATILIALPDNDLWRSIRAALSRTSEEA